MTIATPTITDFDKEDIAPWAGNRLIDLHMATLPSKPFARFFPWSKEKLNLSYQKLRPRYEPMDETTQPACEPLCPEGWYFDCETETCKEYRYTSRIIGRSFEILLDGRRDFITHSSGTTIGPGQYLPYKTNAGFDYSYPSIPNIWFNQPLPTGTLYSLNDYGNFEGYIYPPVGSSIEDIIAFYSTGRRFLSIIDFYNEDLGGYYHRATTYNSWDSILDSYLTKKVSPLVNQSHFLEL